MKRRYFLLALFIFIPVFCADFLHADERSAPAFPLRMVWSWSQPHFDGHGFFSAEEMLNAFDSLSYKRFGDLLASMRVNAFCFWTNYPSWLRDPGEQAERFREAHRVLMRFLKQQYGIDSYIFTVYGMGDDLAQLCPHDPEVREKWRRLIDDLFTQLPDLKGLVMAGAGGDWVRGPWECPCSQCQRHTHRELLLMGVNMIAQPLQKYGAQLIWKNVTDRPTLVQKEVELFSNLEGLLPSNVLIAHKGFYKDFRPTHPLNPMFYHEEAPSDDSLLPYCTEFQIFGEYRGHDAFPCVMAWRWSPIFRLAQSKNESGVMAVVSVAPSTDFDHPLNRANWYAFGQLAWDPSRDPDAIVSDWAKLEFGDNPDRIERITQIARLSYRASTQLMFFKGVMIQNHSQLPTINYELESSLIGPWHDIPRAPEGWMGRGHDVSMYPPEAAQEILDDPNLLLWAHRTPITEDLIEALRRQMNEAIAAVQEIIRLWRGVPIDSRENVKQAGQKNTARLDAPRHREILLLLQQNEIDAQIWSESALLYFEYKAGRLTRETLRRRLDSLRERYPEGGSKLTSGKVYERFFQEWESVLDGTFQRRVMEGKYYTAPQPNFPPGFQE
ncbi:MAG: hypothetical protein JXR73_03000 [Candidatus Omnitrophica bacterium]|nr:hypothetical protein [Candidatus Omnitrophota bacterium]